MKRDTLWMSIIDNGHLEVSGGGQNYLLMGSIGGGKAAAIADTLVETAKMNTTDPQALRALVLRRLIL